MTDPRLWKKWQLMSWVLVPAMIMWIFVVWFFVFTSYYMPNDPYVTPFGAFLLLTWGIGPLVIVVLTWRSLKS